MLKLAIFEPEPRGHHLVLHGRFVIREALARGWNVQLVTTERAKQDKAFQTLVDEFGDRFSVSIMEDVVNEETLPDRKKILQHFERRKAFQNAFKSLVKKPDVVYVVSLDKLDMPVAAFGSPFGKTPFAGLLLLRYFHCPAMGIKTEPLRPREKLMEKVFFRLLKIPTLKKLLTLDQNQEKYAHQSGRKGFEKVAYIPDVASFTGLTPVVNPKTQLGISEDAFVILNYGALTPRKGVEELMAAMEEPNCPVNVVALFAGRQDAATQEIMQSDLARRLIAEGRVIEINRFLNAEDENLAFSAADVVWLGYRRFYGMSGVLVQSASAGKPVIATDEGLVGNLVQTEKLGLSVDIQSAPTVADAIRQLATQPEFLVEFQKRGPVFVKNHTPDLFGKRVCDFIEESAKP